MKTNNNIKETIDTIHEIISKSSFEILSIIYILSFSEIKRRANERGETYEDSKK